VPLDVDAAAQRRTARRSEIARVDEDRSQPIEPLDREAERHQRHLRRDDDPDLVVDHQPAAPLEALLGEQHRDRAAQTPAFVGVEPGSVTEALGEHRLPGGRPRGGGERPSSSASQPRKQHRVTRRR